MKIHKILPLIIGFALIGTVLILVVTAGTKNTVLETEDTVTNIKISNSDLASGGKFIEFDSASSQSNYSKNLERITSVNFRNTNHDNSKFTYTASNQLPLAELQTSYKDYYSEARKANGGFLRGLDNAGQFRVKCEFSHFAYDDPVVLPGQPGQSHLHMFFGNTHSNAYSSYETLIDSGSSTCNGQELNRTSYWVPAMLDADGNARVPENLLVYYKAYGPAVGSTVPYPKGMALVSGSAMASKAQPGTVGNREIFFRCFNSAWNNPADKHKNPQSATIPKCKKEHKLEMNVKFQTCWNGKDPADYKSNASFSSTWPTSGECPKSHPIRLPQMEYRIFWSAESHAGSSNSWFLSSDVNIADESKLRSGNGITIHGDWWGGWNQDINKAWIDNCVNVLTADCDEGLLADARLTSNPKALKRRLEYTGQTTISGQALLKDLCFTGKVFSTPYSTALCDTTVMKARAGIN